MTCNEVNEWNEMTWHEMTWHDIKWHYWMKWNEMTCNEMTWNEMNEWMEFTFWLSNVATENSL